MNIKMWIGLLVLLAIMGLTACGSNGITEINTNDIGQNTLAEQDSQGFVLSATQLIMNPGENIEVYIYVSDKTCIVAGMGGENIISATWDRDEPQVTDKITLFISALNLGNDSITVSDGVTEQKIAVSVISSEAHKFETDKANDETVAPTPTEVVKQDAQMNWSNGVDTYTDELGRELFYFEEEENRLYEIAEELLADENGIFTVQRQESIWGEITYKVVGTKEDYFILRDDDIYMYFGGYKDYLPDGIGMLAQAPLIEAGGELYEIEFIYYLGSFKKGKMDGYGIKYRVPDTDYYYIYQRECLGDWNNTAELPYGQEAIELLYYKEYEGEFKNGKYDGRGNMYYNLLEMDYMYGTLLGIEYGTDVEYEVVPFDRFTIYSGEFSKGELNGYATAYSEKGSIIFSGLWENGEEVEETYEVGPNY